MKATCPDCGKTITVRKDGRFREHKSNTPEWPGSPWKRRCPRSGRPAPTDPKGTR